MPILETVRSRAEHVAYNAVRSSQDAQGITDKFSHLIESKSKGERLASAVSLVGSFIPGFELRVLESLCDTTKLNKFGKNFELIGCGSARYVFSFEDELSEVDKRVLKVGRKNFGDEFYLKDKISQMEADQQQTTELYSEIPGFVPPESYFIGPSLTRDADTIYAYQPQIEGPFHNLFKIPADPLSRIIEGSPNLRFRFQKFVEATDNVFKFQRECPDILGRDNVVLAGEEDPLLIFLDGNHIIRPNNSEGNRKNVQIANLLERIAFLQAVLCRIPNKLQVTGWEASLQDSSSVIDEPRILTTA